MLSLKLNAHYGDQCWWELCNGTGVCVGGGLFTLENNGACSQRAPALTHPSASRRSAGCGMLRSARAQCTPFLAEGDGVATPGSVSCRARCQLARASYRHRSETRSPSLCGPNSEGTYGAHIGYHTVMSHHDVTRDKRCHHDVANVKITMIG